MRALRFLLVSTILWGGARADSQVVVRVDSGVPTRQIPYPGTKEDSSQFPALVASLRFDSTLGAADEQRLMVIDTSGRHYGPLARIEPESGSYLLTEPQLAEGRIIARIHSERRYDKLGLDPGWNWWWVDKRGGRSHTDWRSVFITSRGRKSVRRLDVSEYDHQWKQAIARFLWREKDEGTWGTCGGKCCSSY